MGPRVKAFPKQRGLGYNVVAKFGPHIVWTSFTSVLYASGNIHPIVKPLTLK
jgi:hypothetical protein